MRDLLKINGRRFAFPQRPAVVVCIDGSEPDYHQQAVAAGRMPYLESILRTGADLRADSAMPSFTNPNNLSIATGAPPSVHGISGNYFFDPARGVEVMMNDPSLLRAPTIFAEFAAAGGDVAIITAKDKLRRLLGHNLTKGVCFSAEKADEVTARDNGITDVLSLVRKPLPSVYSADLSEFALAAGVAVLKSRRPDIVYISLTDYIQHKFAPGTPEANDFYAMLDFYFQQLHDLDVTLVVTADHGMNAKADSHGQPQVVYLQELLDEWLGAGAARTILPITDPYTVHHGALGSFACVYLDQTRRADVARRLAATPSIADVRTREEAADRFELPPDRIGDLVVIAQKDSALGTSRDRHDLGQLDRPLRSHGGLTEQRVPFIVNQPIGGLPPGHRLRNFDAYWIALNFVRPGAHLGG
jgi:phosphonoacetate hydrolase